MVEDTNKHNITNLDGLIIQSSNNIEKLKALMTAIENDEITEGADTASQSFAFSSAFTNRESVGYNI